MLVDLHAQTQNTAARGGDPARTIEAAKAAGLGGVAFVDRLHSSHARSLMKAGEAADFPVFVGVEIPAAVGRFLCFAPEIDPFMAREEWRQLMAVLMPPTVERIVQLFDDVGGVVLAAQPYEREDGIRLGDSLVMCDGLAGVEALTPAHSRSDCLLAVEAGVKIGLPLAGGSAGTGQMDRFATLFGAEVRTQAEFIEALRSGNFWAAQLGEVSERPRGPRRPRRADGDGRGRGRDRDRGGRSRDGGRGRGRGRGGPRGRKD